MKVGDLVKFTNRNHSLYRKYSKGVGLITEIDHIAKYNSCLLYTSPSPRDRQKSRMPSSA